MAPIDPVALIPSDDAAAMLSVKPQTLMNWRNEGRGPKYIKIGRLCFYRQIDISAWLADQLVDPSAKRRRTA